MNKASRAALVSVFALAILVSSISSVYAAQFNESWGRDWGTDDQAEVGFGWQQVYGNASDRTYARLTGSSDDMFYDYGFNIINIYTRLESYWSQDCGWWYVRDTENISIKLTDRDGTTGTGSVIASVSSKGVGNKSFEWPALSDPDPGRWTVSVGACEPAGNCLNSTFYIYVRGVLDVSNVLVNVSNPSTNPPSVNTLVKLNATLKDNRNNTVNGSCVDSGINMTPKIVRAYITGAGEYQVLTLDDGDKDGIWTKEFSFQRPGDHHITVQAGDNNTYWIDGWSGNTTAVSGSFSASFGEGNFALLKLLLAFFLAGSLFKEKKNITRKVMSVFGVWR